MIKLYGPNMGSSLRCHWMLHEVGAPFENVTLDMRAREHKQEEFLKINPNGQVPVLVDGDFILSESMAINYYLAEKFGPELLGANIADRATGWQWSIWSYLNVQKPLGTIMFQMNWSPEKDQSAIDKATQEVKPYLDLLDKHLAKHTYILGEYFSVADVDVGVSISYGMYTNYDFSAYPNVLKWMERLTSRSAYIKATAK